MKNFLSYGCNRSMDILSYTTCHSPRLNSWVSNQCLKDSTPVSLGDKGVIFSSEKFLVVTYQRIL